MYLPCLGSHLTIWLLLSKHEIVISDTELDSWNAMLSVARKAWTTLTLLSRDDWSVCGQWEVDSGEARPSARSWLLELTAPS
jgi:hypothetical protein